MKKKLLTLLTCFVLSFSIMIPAFAEEDAEQSSEDSPMLISEQSLPYVVDNADVLTPEEEQEVNSVLASQSESLKFDIVVVVVDSLEGETIVDFADDFFDYEGYGYGDNRDGALLLISMDTHDWYITTRGYGITAFTDTGIQYVGDQITSELADGSFAEAFIEFGNITEEFVLQARSGEPFSADNMPQEPFNWFTIPLALLIGIICAVALALYKKSSLTTVFHKTTATDYADMNTLTITMNNEHFIRAQTTHYVESDDSGGSSTHVSSSGADHGGGGGKF